MSRIIVVEDDTEQLEALTYYLAQFSHSVRGAKSASELESLMKSETPDIVLLDYNLPDADGPQIAAQLRRSIGASVGIVMITARSMNTDRVNSRLAGADDYLVKPINLEELRILINNLQTRVDSVSSRDNPQWILRMTQGIINTPTGRTISLTHSECQLLNALAVAPNQIASREVLVLALGKNPNSYEQRPLEVMVSRLRQKLPETEDGRTPLMATRGIGYKFIFPIKVFH